MPEARGEPAEGPFQQLAREPSLSDKVVDSLLQSVLAGRLRPGDRLPSERDLGERFGVSRTVIREAVRSLAAKGVLDVRSGSGVRIAEVDGSQVAESMRLYLRGSGRVGGDGWQGYREVHDVREMLEVRFAGVAATQAGPGDLERLREAHEAMGATLADVEEASRLDVAFHRAVAQATHNSLYVILLDAIGDVLLEVRRATLGARDRPGLVMEFHQRILDRIAAGDPDGARAAMQAHLDDSAAMWRHLASPS